MPILRFLFPIAPLSFTPFQAQQLHRPQKLQVFRCAFVIDILHDLHPTWTFWLVCRPVPLGQRDFQR